MTDSIDIRRLLEDWPFEPEKHVRIVRGDDGREIMQVRSPLGIEQYELDGRPDGQPVGEWESTLELHLARLEKAKAAGKERSFRIGPAECAALFEEGALYYYRYLHLFQIGDWERTARDTARNLRLFDLVLRYAQRKEDRTHLEQWRPYILRMNTIARAMLEAGHKQHERAVKIVQDGIEKIESLADMDDETFRVERERSIEALRETLAHLENTRPVSELERLNRELRQAIEAQEFERAALLRDRIRALRHDAIE
jgi:hypothetical protein